MSIKKCLTYGFCAGFSLFLLYCTENPIFKEKVRTSENKIITGKVTLDTDSDNSSIIIYLEGLDIITFSDRDGNFKIELTEEQIQFNNNVTGLFKIYYYVANYRIEHSTVLINNGVFVYDLYDLNTRGELIRSYRLRKMLDIHANITVDSISQDYIGTFLVILNLTSLSDSVIITSNMVKDGQFASIIFKSNDDQLLFDLQDSNERTSIITGAIEWFAIIDWAKYDGVLPTGKYEIIPYFQIHQEGIPKRLLSTIGTDANRFSKDYLKIPFQRNVPTLTISAE